MVYAVCVSSLVAEPSNSNDPESSSALSSARTPQCVSPSVQSVQSGAYDAVRGCLLPVPPSLRFAPMMHLVARRVAAASPFQAYIAQKWHPALAPEVPTVGVYAARRGCTSTPLGTPTKSPSPGAVDMTTSLGTHPGLHGAHPMKLAKESWQLLGIDDLRVSGGFVFGRLFKGLLEAEGFTSIRPRLLTPPSTEFPPFDFTPLHRKMTSKPLPADGSQETTPPHFGVVYWPKNWPAVDAVMFVDDSTTIAFQCTLSDDHPATENALKTFLGNVQAIFGVNLQAPGTD